MILFLIFKLRQCIRQLDHQPDKVSLKFNERLEGDAKEKPKKMNESIDEKRLGQLFSFSPLFFNLQNIVLDVLHNPSCPPAGVEVKSGVQLEMTIQMKPMGGAVEFF